MLQQRVGHASQAGRRALPALAAIALTAALTLVMLVPVAAAGPPSRDRIQDGGEDVIENFCGEGNLAVDHTWSIDLRIHVVAHGLDGLEYFLQHGVFRESFTSGEKTVTTLATVLEKDKLVTDNGDGTLTVVVLATGNAVAYGPNGKAIARNPGQLRFVLDIAADGRITRGETVKGSTGRNDDFCAAAVAVLTE
jgi:hypothetical protein